MSDKPRVLVLRPEGQADEIVKLLEADGFDVVAIPAIEILPVDDPTPMDRSIQRIAEYDCIVFTSVNGVEAFAQRMKTARVSPAADTTFAAIGPATASAMEGFGMKVDWMPTRFTTQALAEELPQHLRRVLLVRADIATTELEDRLRERGFGAERVDAYRTGTVNTQAIRRQVETGVHVVLATSASVARSFAEAISGLTQPPILSIGPATTQACDDAGLSVADEAYEHTIGGLIGCLERYLRN